MAATSKIKIKRSSFHGLFVAVTDLAGAETVVAEQRRRWRKARHHVWACRVRDGSGQLLEQARDDGEVGRPGHALLELLRHGEVEGCLVVSRVYGGVKLGVGGVTRAIREAGNLALDDR